MAIKHPPGHSALLARTPVLAGLAAGATALVRWVARRYIPRTLIDQVTPSTGRLSGTIMAVRLRPVVSIVAVFAICAAGLPLLAPPAAAKGGAGAQRQIARAFATLVRLPALDRGALYLEGYDTAMRTALQQAGSLLTEGYDVPVTVQDLVGTAQIVGTDEAVVPFTVRVIPKSVPSSSLAYDAVALKVGGRWKVSWTTMCLLVESGRQLCPPTPRGLVAGDVLPSAASGSLAVNQGVVRPGPLAIASNGGLLVADEARNQILEWRDGTVSVVAGDGLQGFSGDGGPAVDAKLSDPGEIAVAANGTIYFVDEGNERVRAVSPAGTITTVAGDGSTGQGADIGDGEPATDVPLNPSGVAVAPDGTLYVSSGSDIRTEASDGVISTLVRGGPPYGGNISVHGTPIAFEPMSLALEGDGDLVVFSFSPKELFQVDPADGAVTEVAQDYATALAPAPDGSVLVAEHGGDAERVSAGVLAPLQASSAKEPTVVDGIAEAADGTVYTDTDYGDGFNDTSGLYSEVNGVPQPLLVTSSLSSSLPAVGAPGFPAAVFPSTTSANGSHLALALCPSLTGVVPFTPAAVRAARRTLGLWNSSFAYDLQASDRSWWAGDVATFTGGELEGRQTVGPAKAAADTLYAPAIEAACGRKLVEDSTSVVMQPSAYDFGYQHVYLIDRGGTPLVYFGAY